MLRIAGIIVVGGIIVYFIGCILRAMFPNDSAQGMSPLRHRDTRKSDLRFRANRQNRRGTRRTSQGG